MATKWTAAQQRMMLHKNYELFDKWLDTPNGSAVGIDFSLTSTGIVLLNRHGEFLKSTAIETTAKDGTEVERIRFITEAAKDVLTSVACPPAVISVEAINVGTHFSSVVSNARVSGAIYQVINDIYHRIYPYMLFCNVSSLKGAVAEQGASKSHMLMEVFAKWGKKLDTDDEADAFVAAKIGHKLVDFFECYGNLVKDCDDLQGTLMDICKNRHEGFYEALEAEGIDKAEADALIGIMTGSREGGSGLNQMKENNKDFYYEAREELKEV